MKSTSTSRAKNKRKADLEFLRGYDPWDTADSGMRYDRAEAERAAGFFRDCLVHVSGEWNDRPFKLSPWQDSIIRHLFGWKRKDGSRRYREALIYIPRKNGKTTLAAGIANYLLFCDGEPGATIFCAAADRDQASLVFRTAQSQVSRNPVLKEHSTLLVRAIVNNEFDASIKPISSDVPTKHGLSAHGVILDELHAQRNRDLYDVLKTSMGARRQPLFVSITTADYDRESICNEVYDYACKVRDGVIDDPTFLPVIYEATKDDDWESEETWRKANPNLGVSLHVDYMAREAKRAKEVPSYQNSFLRFHLNIRTEQAQRWIMLDDWDACGAQPVCTGPCWAGLDMSSTVDITAFVLWFPESGSIVPYFFVPSETVDRREREDRVPYSAWVRAGLITPTRGARIDYDTIEASIAEIAKRHEIVEIAYDPWQCRQTAQRLSDMYGLTMVEYPQNFGAMNEPTRRLETLIAEGKIRHGGNAVLRWMASNAAVDQDAMGNIRLNKKKSAEKIDGLVAAVMAIGRWISSGGRNIGSVYEDRGLVML